MIWFLAKVVFHIITPKGQEQGQFEEVLIIVEARNKVEAFEKAAKRGRSDASEFVNSKGDKIHWEFVAVSQLQLLPEFTDGLMLDSHLEKIGAQEEFISLQLEKQRRILEERQDLLIF